MYVCVGIYIYTHFSFLNKRSEADFSPFDPNPLSSASSGPGAPSFFLIKGWQSKPFTLSPLITSELSARAAVFLPALVPA